MQKRHVQITRLVNSTTSSYRYASKASMYNLEQEALMTIDRPIDIPSLWSNRCAGN